MQFSKARHNAARAFPQTLALAARLATAATAATVVLAAATLCGCSIALPGGASEKAWRAESDDATGTIPATRRPRSLSPMMEAEDWRRAAAAMATALDPQGSGAAVNWDNPANGARGAFTPIGQAYPTEGLVCRAFLAEFSLKENRQSLQGTACREKTAEWSLREVKPFRKG